MENAATRAPPNGMGGIDAILTRRCIRAFLPEPVPRETIEDILKIASRAPSGTNTQPWHVTVVTGAPLAALGRELEAIALSGDKGREPYQYYPSEWRSPYIERRRKVGWDLYGTLGITRDDKARMARQLARNFIFFDAPVGFMFTIDADLEIGSWLDYGMFLENIMIAARCFGLDTCPQQAFSRYQHIIFERLAMPPGRTLVCGMSMGYADLSAPENNFRTERAPLSEFATFVGAPEPARSPSRD